MISHWPRRKFIWNWCACPRMKKRGPCPTPKNSVNAKNYIFVRLITAIGDIKNSIQVNRSPRASSHLRSDSFFLFDSCFGNTKVLGSSHLFIVISNPKFGFRARKSEEEWKTEKNVNRFPFTSRRMKSNIYWSGYMVGVIGVASRRRMQKGLPPF